MKHGRARESGAAGPGVDPGGACDLFADRSDPFASDGPVAEEVGGLADAAPDLDRAARRLAARYGAAFTACALERARGLAGEGPGGTRRALDLLSRAAGSGGRIDAGEVERAAAESALDPEDLRARLEARLFGRSETVAALLELWRTRAAGLFPDRAPTLLLVGPDGVGKAACARAAAAVLGRSLLRVDLREHPGLDGLRALLGPPPGLPGAENGGRLTGALRRRPASLLLIEGWDAADPEVAAVLARALARGRLCDGIGREVATREAWVVLTARTRAGGAARAAEAADAALDLAPIDAEARARLIAARLREMRARLAAEGVAFDWDPDLVGVLAERGPDAVSRALAPRIAAVLFDRPGVRRLRARAAPPWFRVEAADA